MISNTKLIYSQRYRHDLSKSLAGMTTLTEKAMTEISLKEFWRQYDTEIVYVPIPERLKESERFIAMAIELSEAYEIDLDIKQTPHCIEADLHLYYAAYPGELTRMIAKLINMCDTMSFFFISTEPSDFTLSLEFQTHKGF